MTYAATIDWGDGTQETVILTPEPGSPDGTLSGGDGSLFSSGTHKMLLSNVSVGMPRSPDDTLSGSHVYADNGVYTVQVCVTDSLAETGCDTLTITVENVPPTVGDGQRRNADQGGVVGLLG